MTHGSQWRKWDLHVHTPATRLNNQFRSDDINESWRSFCETINQSDVHAVGITDYFDIHSFFEFKRRYREFYPEDDSRVFFPNLELRLDRYFNKKIQHANVHVIFRPDLTEDDAVTFSYNLKLALTDSPLERNPSMKEVESWTSDQLEGATVKIEEIRQAIKSTFKDIDHPTDAAIIVASGRSDGLSPNGSQSLRNYHAIDSVDAQVDAIFARSRDAEHWLNSARGSGAIAARPKPTFGGCDAHSLEELKKTLGRSGTDESRTWETTWIKADLNYEGLLQTLAEPSERVRIQEGEPDAKPDMYVIDRIEFPGADKFPTQVKFGRNLNAIIGSRSSGKSALLAYIAHAANPDETIRQQELASPEGANPPGPAAGHTWKQVESIDREIVWASGSRSTGGIVYIPQNSLYSLSNRPREVSAKIEPVLFKEFPSVSLSYQQHLSRSKDLSERIGNYIQRWLDWQNAELQLVNEIEAIGERGSIEESHKKVKADLDKARADLSLSDDEIIMHKSVQDELEALDSGAAKFEQERAEVDIAFGTPKPGGEDTSGGMPGVRVELSQNITSLPVPLRNILQTELARIQAEGQSRIRSTFLEWRSQSDERLNRTSRQASELRVEHAELLAKIAGASVVDELTKSERNHRSLLAQIAEKEEALGEARKKRVDIELDLRTAIESRKSQLDNFIDAFEAEPRQLDDVTVEAEQDFDPELLHFLASDMRQNKKSEYLTAADDGELIFAIDDAQGDPASFLRYCEDDTIPLKKGVDRHDFARRVLTAEPEMRFAAIMDGDRIGGYSASTMTPGKQALFALTLILHESDAPWPLLIDQPEDDLDSRSIFAAVVPYLLKRKQERQIIMVTHDANLVVGADAEAVIVANRHGDDRPNLHGREFDYRTGSIEDLTVEPESASTLAKQGIRDHCCDILDGGTEAFLKRKDKYRLHQ